MSDNNINSLIKNYFYRGFQYNEIILCLSKHHNIRISKRSLKRRLQKLSLYRRKHYSDTQAVISFIEDEIQKSAQLHGYRWMHLKCIQAGFRIKRETVSDILKLVDPLGVEIRSRKRLRRRVYTNPGPNYLWHIDSYDKLKPFGIGINGCIDGFARKIIWLRASFTNNNPKVIGGYYIQAVKEIGGCPRTIRSDMGTENSYVENMQIFLRQENEINPSIMPPFLYGTSQCNQRIECWWSVLRKHNSQFWINLLQTLRDDGVFNGTFLDKSLIRYCFMDIIQKELDTIVQEWDAHRITKSRNGISPTGRPFVMYNFPELHGSENYLIKVASQFIEVCEENCQFLTTPCDEDVNELCEILLSELNITKSSDIYEAINLYCKLRSEILAIL